MWGPSSSRDVVWKAGVAAQVGEVCTTCWAQNPGLTSTSASEGEEGADGHVNSCPTYKYASLSLSQGGDRCWMFYPTRANFSILYSVKKSPLLYIYSVCVCVCVCVGQWVMGVFFINARPCVLRQGISLNLGLPIRLNWLTNEPTPGAQLHPCFQHKGCAHESKIWVVSSGCHTWQQVLDEPPWSPPSTSLLWLFS